MQGWGYAVFGKVVKGTEVVDQIKGVKNRQTAAATVTCPKKTS